MDLRKMKTDLLRVDFSDTLEDEDEDDEEKTSPTSLPEVISGMNSANSSRILMATKSLRRMLIRESDSLIEKIIEAGLLTLLVTFLGCDDEPLLQCEAAWALINIASGTSQQTHAVVQAGAVPQLIRLLVSPHVRVVYNCVWALGNIMEDGTELRDFVIESGILPPLMRLVDKNAPPKFLRTLTWVILNLCRNDYHKPKSETINACLPALRILIRHTDYDILSDTCWAFSYVVDGSYELVQPVIKSSGLLSRIVELLGNPEPRVITPALQTIVKITSGNDSRRQAVIDCNVLQMLPALLLHSDANIKKLACIVVSNITWGSSEKIQAVINSNLLPLVVEVLKTGDSKSQIQVTWVIIGLTRRGTLDQISYVVQCGALKSLCDLLATKEATLLIGVVHCIFCVLDSTNKFGQVEPLCVLLKEMRGLDKIDELQNHEDWGVRSISKDIIQIFF